METAPSETLFEDSRHPYTRALLSALPHADPGLAEQRERIVLAGDPPSPIAPPSGCRFHAPCPKARSDCVTDLPEPRALVGEGFEAQLLECLHPLEPGEDLSSFTPMIEDTEIGLDSLALEVPGADTDETTAEGELVATPEARSEERSIDE